MRNPPVESDLCNCEQMKEAIAQKRIEYEWFVCNCSPFERTYYLDGKLIRECPYCKKGIPVHFQPLKLKLKCPKCGHEW